MDVIFVEAASLIELTGEPVDCQQSLGMQSVVLTGAISSSLGFNMILPRFLPAYIDLKAVSIRE